MGQSAASSKQYLIAHLNAATLRAAVVLLCAFTASSGFCSPAVAADTAPAISNPAPPPSRPAASGTSSKERNFYEVLEDLLGDFEYDLKNGQVNGLRDLAVRNIATSENIPPSFRNHLELVVTERILNTSKTRVVQCLPCRAKRTTLSGDQMVITSAETNPVELSRIAKLSGIQHFMDIAFTYQPNGLVLSLYITEPESGAVVWSRSYNSETSRAAASRRGVDFSQIDDARKQTEYQPTIQYRATVGYMFEPNIGTMTGCLNFGFRMVERYDNRKKEVGFELDYLKDSSSIAGNPAAATTANLYSGLNLTLLFLHTWNMIGNEENYNRVRGNIFAGVGGTYSAGFLGGLVRGGYEWRLAKHWAVNANLGYRPRSTTFFTDNTSKTVSGVEYGLGISATF
ncbi:MAG: hypothetical protein H7222_01505 [Methylotenera sp.]|nr:hypothetical protein [Oligoflexia bacterium]